MEGENQNVNVNTGANNEPGEQIQTKPKRKSK